MTTRLPPPTAATMSSNSNPNPMYDLQKGRYTSTMKIGKWTIEATKKPILNGKEIEAAEKSLNLPLPEMTFGNNSLVLTYASSNDSDVVILRFDTLEALACVAVGQGWEERIGGGVLVSMADKWKNRTNPSLLSDTPVPTKPVKPHDWTYSTCYDGSVAGPSTYRPSPTHSLPMALLARQDPILDRILYYDDVPLYEDELHDNGESILNVRIRVMPHCFFILSRLFVRVDLVLFRMYDVRIYHQFGSNEIIKEINGMEVNYDHVKQNLQKTSDLSPLTNPNWVYGIMSSISETTSTSTSTSTTDAANANSGKSKPWPGLGKRVDVLYLPTSPGCSGSGAVDVSGTTDQLERVRI